MDTVWPEPVDLAIREVPQKKISLARSSFLQVLHDLDIRDYPTALLEKFYTPLAIWVLQCRQQSQTLCVGVSGAQGSGKTTLCRLLGEILSSVFGASVVILSIDDFYLTRAQRKQLAESVHTLFMTRGVPGTHDIELALDTVDALSGGTPGKSIPLPVFDKSTDERTPKEQWRVVSTPVDIVLFEGWCVGARPQADSDLEAPVNDFERCEDSDATWRRTVNQKLAGEYQRLFKCLDRLVYLKIEDFSDVLGWRVLQEEKLGQRFMDRRELQRFVAHYERLSRSMMEDMPRRADIVVDIGPDHLPGKVSLQGNLPV